VEGNLSDPLKFGSGLPAEPAAATFDGKFVFNDADGHRLQAIAKHLGVHYAMVSRRLKQLEIRVRIRAE
jgi:hypothetical protein